MRLVVSLYKEDPEWIMYVPKHWDVVVYIKDINHHFEHVGKLMKRAIVMRLENCGRESHTWFHHTCHTYGNRTDNITVFAQGNPWDHTPNFGEILNCHNLHQMAERSLLVHSQNDPVCKPDYGYVGLGGSWLQDTNEFDVDHLELAKEEATKFPLLWEAAYGTKNHPEKIRSVWGAQYAIRKDLVHKFPESFYRKVYKMHYDPKHWILPWALEKILPEIYLHDWVA